MSIRAQTPQKVIINQIKILESETENVTISLDEEVDLSDNGITFLPEIQESDETKDIDIEIQYSSGNLENLISSGAIVGNLELNKSIVWKDDFCANREKAYVKTEHSSRGELTNGGWIIEEDKCQIRSDTSNSDLTIHTTPRRSQIEDVHILLEYLGTSDDDGSGPIIYDSGEDRWWLGSITNDHGCNGIGYIEGGDVNCVVNGENWDVTQEHTFDFYYRNGTLEFYVNDQKSAEYDVDISPDGFGMLSDAQNPPAYYDSILVKTP